MVLVDSHCNKTLPKSRRQTVGHSLFSGSKSNFWPTFFKTINLKFGGGVNSDSLISHFMSILSPGFCQINEIHKLYGFLH